MAGIGKKILRAVASKSERIFFEPPGEWAGPLPFEEADQRPFDEGYSRYVSNEFAGSLDVEFLGFTEFSPDTGEDPMFVIHCSDYEGPT